MKIWKNLLKLNLIIIIKCLVLILSFSNILYSNEIDIEIKGNDFTDKIAITSLIKKKPTEISDKYSNYILKTLTDSSLFEDVKIDTIENKYVVIISEFANINKIYFKNNERFDDEELRKFASELNLNNVNPLSLNLFIDEMTNLYETFGYNNINISYNLKIFDDTNTADLYFDFDEGKITKINKIYFSGNFNVDTRDLKSIIQSKTKSIVNIFANNNFKKFEVDNDLRLIKNYYKKIGYRDIEVNSSIEYLNSNKINLYFNLIEGNLYTFKEIDFLDNNNLLNKDIINQINFIINDNIKENENYSLDKITYVNKKISDFIIKNGTEFFEINSLEKINMYEVSVLYNIKSITPKYTNQINIYGNTRTMDKVIRRELELAEGDAFYGSQINNIQNKLTSLNLFKSVSIVEKELENNLVDLEINIEEKQTGTFNAGLSIGTIDGIGLAAGLSERNFYGTGRSLKALINTTDNKQQLTLETTDRILYENDVDITYRTNYRQEDFSRTSSYNLDTFLVGTGIGYNINSNLRHSINLDYVIKNYKVTNSSTVATAIRNSSGENVSFVLKNNLFYNTLNSLRAPNNGNYVSFSNLIETPNSSSNGFIKNIVTLKNYKKFNNNILSIQTRAGNIVSFNDNNILTDDKFSLGGRWLRGFDAYGAGPRNSRTSYVGGNNLIVTKLDFSREITRNSNFPLYFNLFNDYGLIWENKTKPTNNDNSLRSSVGFGIKYYSPIGPIGFSWGFPLMDEEYDIKRMFLFSVGNID